MGPKQSANQQSHHATPTIPHPRFDKVKFLNSRDHEYLQIQLPVVSESQVKEWHKSYKPLLAHECLLLPLSHQFKGTQLCGSSGLCEIKFDNYPFLLQGQISDRTVNQKKYFQNSELLYLCLTILQAANIFHSQDSKIGDMRPLNVFINEYGQAKIANRLTWPHETTNYEKTVYEKEITYLAPEEIKYEYFGHTQPKVNIQISQSFSVGLTLLDSALLGKSSDLYNLKNNRFDYELLERRLNELFALPNYDQTVKKVIAGLCHINHQERLKCREVFVWLNKYREKIINIEPFSFEEIPQFLITPAKSLPIQSILRPTLPIYFESQAVLASTPLRFAAFQQNNGNYAIQRVENRMERVLEQPKQIIYVEQMAGREAAKLGALKQNQQDFKLTLSKIEQQLEMSRRMFPS